MSTYFYILLFCAFICSTALLISLRIIKELNERLESEIKNNERLKKLYDELSKGA